MTTKKKTTATAAPEPRTAPKKTPAKAKVTAEAQPVELRPVDIQLRTWNSAMELFTKGRYEDAAELFRQTTTGPAVHVSDKARTYLQICERRCARPSADFKTADEHYYFAVERLNARDLGRAGDHFRRALQLQPDGDNILYALSLCCGLSGDADGAYDNLKRAIDLDPKNRLVARQDSEFRELATHIPALASLLSTEAAAGR